MERKVEIKTDRRKFPQQYLQVIKPVMKEFLTEGELRVLGELMYYTDKFKKYPSDIREKLLLDGDTRAEIQTHLDISSNTFANALTVLRKKNFLIGREIAKAYHISPNSKFKVNFNFSINEG